MGIESELPGVYFPGLSLALCSACLLQAFGDLAQEVLGPENTDAPPTPGKVRRILILGGGFGGMETARQLEGRFAGDTSVAYQPGERHQRAIVYSHARRSSRQQPGAKPHTARRCAPVIRRTEFIRGRVIAIDLQRQTIRLDGVAAGNVESSRDLSYDQLVLALGAVSNYLGLKEVERVAFDFRSLFDAIQIRNRVIEMFEQADRESDPEVRKRLLTFVIAGGGFAGVELAGALNDFAHGILADYQNLSASDLSVTLVHSRDRVLPELSDSLANYAMQKMKERGVRFRLATRLIGAQAGSVRLTDGAIATETLIWTAGPFPIHSSRHWMSPRINAARWLSTARSQSPGLRGVWALGDCAAVNDGVTGNACPPTAQFALREASARGAKHLCFCCAAPGRGSIPL